MDEVGSGGLSYYGTVSNPLRDARRARAACAVAEA